MNIKTSFVPVLIASLILSCSAKKSVVGTSDNQSVSTEDTYEVYAENVGISEKDSTAVAVKNGSSETMKNNQAKIIKGNNDGYDYNRMVSTLKMTQDQTRQFKMAMEKFKEQRISTANGDMMGTIEDERNRQLEKILTKEQLKIYRYKER